MVEYLEIAETFGVGHRITLRNGLDGIFCLLSKPTGSHYIRLSTVSVSIPSISIDGRQFNLMMRHLKI